jgi:hypothetical protein
MGWIFGKGKNNSVLTKVSASPVSIIPCLFPKNLKYHSSTEKYKNKIRNYYCIKSLKDYKRIIYDNIIITIA